MSFIALGVIAGAGVVGAIGSTVAGSEAAGAANEAAHTQANIAHDAQQQQLAMFNETQANEKPFTQFGQGALGNLGQLLGIGTGPGGANGTPDYSSFYNSPGFGFNKSVGMNAINSGANASGSLYTPNTQANLGGYASGLASNTFLNNFLNPLMNSATLGANTAVGAGSQAVGAGGNLGNVASAAGQGISNSITNAGMMNASGVAGATGSLSGVLNNPLLQQYIKGMGTGITSDQYSQNVGAQPLSLGSGYTVGANQGDFSSFIPTLSSDG